jgi:hypothetical protein
MLYPRAVCFSSALLFTLAGNALAQGSPGYRMRFPAGTIGPRPGSPVRPPRLTVTPPGRSADGSRRQFFSPGQYFGVYPFGWYGYESTDSSGDYPADSMPVREVDPADYAREVKPARNVQALDDSAAVGKLQVTQETRGSNKAVRLTWRDQGAGATQVAFFLADSARVVLAAETVRTPPFTWLFEPHPRMAFAGMTVVLRGGSLVTQYVPYRR